MCKDLKALHYLQQISDVIKVIAQISSELLITLSWLSLFVLNCILRSDRNSLQYRAIEFFFFFKFKTLETIQQALSSVHQNNTAILLGQKSTNVCLSFDSVLPAAWKSFSCRRARTTLSSRSLSPYKLHIDKNSEGWLWCLRGSSQLAEGRCI